MGSHPAEPQSRRAAEPQSRRAAEPQSRSAGRESPTRTLFPMNRVLRIADKSVPLTQILTPLNPRARGLSWSILDLGEVVPGDGWDPHVPFTEQRVLDSPKGWELTFEELRQFADWSVQVIDGVFVASESSGSLPKRSDDDATVLERADVVLAAIDSSFWVISGPDDVLAPFERVFHDVSEQKPQTVELSTWGRDY